MTEEATPREVGSHAGLGPVPERDLVERLRSRRNFMSTDGLRWYMTATPDGDCEEAAAEIERLRAKLAQQIDYPQLIADCYSRTKQAQGTKGCVQFARGAEWWREQIQKA
jgi:hypothetical protein